MVAAALNGLGLATIGAFLTIFIVFLGDFEGFLIGKCEKMGRNGCF
jgi:hypothetical protein